MDMQTGEWCEELFQVAGVDIKCAPRLVPPGTILGKLVGPLSELAAYRDTLLIAPACHDTASAIAGIPAEGDDWAYISSGTWSLVGTLLDAPLNDFAVRTENFTNLAGVGGKTLFHKNVNGLWLLRQCMAEWEKEGNQWSIPELIQAAQIVPQPPGLLDVDDPQLILAGAMPSRINLQRQSMGLKPLAEHSRNAPAFASLIFHSLAARYAAVLGWLAEHSGRKFKRLYIVGGGSRNEFLNRLTEEATGLPVFCGSTESSTIGNFAVQLAALTRTYNYGSVVTSSEVSKLARLLLAGPNA
jgi:rhamnulokinase